MFLLSIMCAVKDDKVYCMSRIKGKTGIVIGRRFSGFILVNMADSLHSMIPLYKTVFLSQCSPKIARHTMNRSSGQAKHCPTK